MKRAVLGCLLVAACGGSPSTMAPDMTSDVALTISTGTFTVAAGTERTQCMYMPSPSGGEIAIQRYVAHMPPGSHHFNFYYLPSGMGPAQAGLQDCTYDHVPVWLAGSQWPDIDYTLPDGKAIKIPKGAWLMLESHFVNATTQDATAHVDVTLHTVPVASVTEWAGVYFNVMSNIHVAPMTHATLTARCAAHPGSTVFLYTSHMHHFGQEFDINLYDDTTSAVTPVYSSTDWEHPKIEDVSAKPLVIGDNQGFEWKCHYYNDRPTDLYGGGSAVDNEMCIMTAFYWPAAPGVPYCYADAM